MGTPGASRLHPRHGWWLNRRFVSMASFPESEELCDPSENKHQHWLCLQIKHPNEVPPTFLRTLRLLWIDHSGSEYFFFC